MSLGYRALSLSDGSLEFELGPQATPPAPPAQSLSGSSGHSQDALPVAADARPALGGSPRTPAPPVADRTRLTEGDGADAAPPKPGHAAPLPAAMAGSSLGGLFDHGYALPQDSPGAGAAVPLGPIPIDRPLIDKPVRLRRASDATRQSPSGSPEHTSAKPLSIVPSDDSVQPVAAARKASDGGAPVAAARKASDSGSSVPTARKASDSGSSVPTARKASDSGSSVPTARKASDGGAPAPTARKASDSGSFVPTARKASDGGAPTEFTGPIPIDRAVGNRVVPSPRGRSMITTPRAALLATSDAALPLLSPHPTVSPVVMMLEDPNALYQARPSENKYAPALQLSPRRDGDSPLSAVDEDGADEEQPSEQQQQEQQQPMNGHHSSVLDLSHWRPPSRLQPLHSSFSSSSSSSCWSLSASLLERGSTAAAVAASNYASDGSPYAFTLSRSSVPHPVPSEPQGPTVETDNWCERFRIAFTEPDLHVRNVRLLALRDDFNSCAEAIGRIILQERYIDTQFKSIKPVGLGGVAGGEKYIARGILFKFAQDPWVGTSFMYGGAESDDRLAAKAAGHELKSISAILKFAPQNLLMMPLMVCIDFYGYRLSAQALLPIKDGALVYGSKDGGRTVHTAEGHEHLKASLEDVFERSLRLAKHTVLDHLGHAHTFVGPADLEIHQGTNGMYYLLDAARLMPPVRPKMSRTNAVFYELFRPEFLLWNNEPLSSDAFSRFGRGDPAGGEAVTRASLRLLRERIPELAHTLTPNACTAVVVSQTFHSYGVNMRYLGLVRSAVLREHTDVRQRLLEEMLLRVLKHWVLDELRQLVFHLRSPTLTPLLSAMQSVFQLFVSDHKLWMLDAPGSVKARLVLKFGRSALTQEEMHPAHSLKYLFPRVLDMLCRRSGVRLSEDMINRVLQAPVIEDVRFLLSDFTLKPVLKELDITLGALEESLRRDAKFKQGQQKLSLLEQALTIAKGRVIAEPKSLRMHVSLMRALCIMTKQHLRDSVAVQGWLVQTSDALRALASLAREKGVDFIELYYLASKVHRLCYQVEATNCAEPPRMPELLEHWKLAWQAVERARDVTTAITQWNLNADRVQRLQRRIAQDLWEAVFHHLRSAADYPLFVHMLQPVASYRFVESTLLHADVARLHFFPVYMGLCKGNAEVLRALGAWLQQQGAEHLVELRDWSCDWLSDATCCELLTFLCTHGPFTRLSLNSCTLVTTPTMSSLVGLVGERLLALNLDSCWRLRDDDIRLLVRGCPRLQKLSLRRLLHISDTAFAELARLPELYSLDLTECVSLRSMPPHAEWPALEKLALEDCVKLCVLPEHFRMPRLRVLNLLRLPQLSKEVLQRLLSALPALQSLQVSASHVGDGVFDTVEALRSLAVRECPLAPTQLVRAFPNLTQLELRNYEAVSMGDLRVLFAELPELQSIDVSHCLGLQDAGLQEAVQALITTTLTRFCALGAVEDVFGALTQRFDLTEFRGLVAAAPDKSVVLSNMRALELESSMIGDDDATSIIERLERIVELRIVACRRVTMRSLALLPQSSPLLRRLDLEDVGVTTQAIFASLNKMSALREVRLGGFTFESPKLHKVHFLRQLTSLEFYHCNFGSEFWRLVAFCTRQLRRLLMLRCIPEPTIELDLAAHPMLELCSLRRVGVKPLNVALVRHLTTFEAYMVENIAGYTFFKGNGPNSLSITFLSLDDIAALGPEERDAFAKSPVAAGLLTLHNLNLVDFYLVCPNLYKSSLVRNKIPEGVDVGARCPLLQVCEDQPEKPKLERQGSGLDVLRRSGTLLSSREDMRNELRRSIISVRPADSSNTEVAVVFHASVNLYFALLQRVLLNPQFGRVIAVYGYSLGVAEYEKELLELRDALPDRLRLITETELLQNPAALEGVRHVNLFVAGIVDSPAFKLGRDGVRLSDAEAEQEAFQEYNQMRNCVGVFEPLLLASRARVVFLSGRWFTFACTTGFSHYGGRIIGACHNMFAKVLSLRLERADKGAVCASFTPQGCYYGKYIYRQFEGQPDWSGPEKGAELLYKFCMNIQKEHHGKFITDRGTVIPVEAPLFA